MENLNDLRIASPCKASWAAMRGNDRVRFCDACSKHVYNISALTEAEARSLVEDGPVCVRLYRRWDGTVLTGDCPVGLRQAIRRRLMRPAAAAVVLFTALRSGLWLYADGESYRGIPALPTSVKPDAWIEWATSAFGFGSPNRGVTMGAICPAVASPVTPPDPLDE